MSINRTTITTLENQLETYDLPSFMKVQKLNLLRFLYQQENDVKEFDIAKEVIDEITANIKTYSEKEQIEALKYLKEAYTRRGRVDFHSFMIALEWDRPIEKKFYQPRMRIFTEFGLIQALQDLADGKVNILILNMPPRAGKSTLGLLYLVWSGGRNVLGSILGAGYSTSLAKSFYSGCLEFINNPEYRYYDIFPEAKLSTSAEYMTIDLGVDGRYKTMTFRSIDGTVTGATEANELLYLDDLCSGIEEAMNIDRLKKLWDKVTVDMLQRRVKNKRTGKTAPILAIGTLWSLHDPMSKLKREFEDNEDTVIIQVPALNENGESNFDYDYGVGFDTKYYTDMKSLIDEVSFLCVYQQQPIEREGLLIREDELSRYHSLPNTEPDNIIAFCDVAFGGKDFLSFPIAYVYGEEIFIEDVVFTKGDYKITQPLVTGKIVEHNIQQAVFEANNGGDFYSRDVADMVKQENHRMLITTQRASSAQSKLSRIIQHSPAIKKMHFKSKELYTPNSMYAKFIQNLTTFLVTGKSPNDDAPDSLAGLASIIRIPLVAKVVTTSRKGAI